MANEYEGWRPAGKSGRGMHQRVGGLDYETIPWKPVKMPGQGKRRVGELLRDENYQCAFCGGTGERPKGSKCPACRGEGEVHLNPPAVTCAFCNGTGENEPRSQVTCPVCKGKGIVSVVEPIKICSTCNGRGRTVGSPLYCITCRGKGVVTVKGKVDETGGETKAFIARPSGTARDIAETIYQMEEGGQADYQQIARKLRISPYYTESICKQMTERGYLKKISRSIYALSSSCERLMQEEEEKEQEALSSDEIEVLKIIVMAKDDEEVKSIDIAKKMGFRLPDVNKMCNKLGKQNFINISLSGKIDLTEKGIRALEYIFAKEELGQSQVSDSKFKLPETKEDVEQKDEQWKNLKEYKM